MGIHNIYDNSVFDLHIEGYQDIVMLQMTMEFPELFATEDKRTKATN